jgi:hypothetical protein
VNGGGGWEPGESGESGESWAHGLTATVCIFLIDEKGVGPLLNPNPLR